jgi:hypothetical protein
MADSTFYDADKLTRLATNLFYGWGYNFYRVENQLRADDQMVRARVCEILGAARLAVETAEAAYRREYLPPPSREKPRPEAQAVRNAQALESLTRDLGALEGHIRALPVPEADRMTQRFRREAETLSRLVEADQSLVAQAEFLRALLAGTPAAWILDHTADLRAQIGGLQAAIQSRRDLLAF